MGSGVNGAFWRGFLGMQAVRYVKHLLFLGVLIFAVTSYVRAMLIEHGDVFGLKELIQCAIGDSEEIKESYRYAENAAHEAAPCYSNSPSDNLLIAESLRESGGYGKCDNPVKCIDVLRSETRNITICKHVSEFLTEGFPTAADIHVSEGMSVEKAIAEYCM